LMFHLTRPLMPGQPACNTSYHCSTAALFGITMSAHWDSSERTTISSAIHLTMTSRLYCPRTWPSLPCSYLSKRARPGPSPGGHTAAGTLVPPGPRSILPHLARLRDVYPARRGSLQLRMDSSCAQRMGRSFKTWIMMDTNKPAGLSFTCTSNHATAFSQTLMFTLANTLGIHPVKAAFQTAPTSIWRGDITANGSLRMGICHSIWKAGSRVETVLSMMALSHAEIRSSKRGKVSLKD